jgi:transitional endoplasmic reticulum ATPase
VGADIEALVREGKLAAMREFIRVMDGKSPEEMGDAVINIRLTGKHFQEARKKVKGSLADEALEAAELQAWEMLYSGDQREVLENALTAIKRVKFLGEGAPDTTVLHETVFARAKDWNKIKRLTHRLEEDLKAAP